MRRQLVILILMAGGCEAQSPPPSPVRTTAAPPPAPPVWRTRDGSEVVAIEAEQARSAIAAAAMQARSTAARARERWTTAGRDERDRWAVKWAAETMDGGVEHVWVRPTAWSAFRIEGILASPPQHELLCGAEARDPVAFPVEALSDWLYEPADGPREGGFSIDAIEGSAAP